VRAEVIVGRDPATGQGIRLRIEDDKIASMEPSGEAGDLWLSAGLIDLQVNGYAGLDFNGSNCTVESVIGIVDALLATGVTSLAPTVITASEIMMTRSLKIIAEARRLHPHAADCIPFGSRRGTRTSLPSTIIGGPSRRACTSAVTR
jgi:N-acetylglucosamine-6-phosphate deacetylase